ncbi:MAG TPA: hypothetical protein VI796_03910, partial [Candidatus Thermoplasmatota archaeon]|nr:hypothetical protein [Candidatus Thermoplasmatota archaeon]
EAPALPLFSGGDAEVGSVLTHELGHYAFGMQDMYTDLGTGPDCYDAGTSVSVMGSNRDATEYDDEVNRCPNESLLSGYEPAWTSLRQRFDAVPDRTGPPDPGPEGDGGRFQLSTFDAGP